jgi:hypothetical protein
LNYLLYRRPSGEGLRQVGDDHSGWGRGYRQQRIDNANGTHPSREHKACKDTTKKSGIGDWTEHGRTPVTPSNRFPSPIAVQIGCLDCGSGIHPLYWMSGTASPLQTRHSARACPNIKHIGPRRLWHSRKRVHPSVHRQEQRAWSGTTLPMLFAVWARLHRSMPSHCSIGLSL